MIAIMQPYLFPYLGYFQLIHAVDTFVLYDDVNYIKQGYINRNSLLSAGETQRFTIPVPGASSFKKICELEYSIQNNDKFLKGIAQAYSKAPYYNDVYPIIEKIINFEDRNIGALCKYSFEVIFSYLGSYKKFLRSSEIDYDHNGPASDKLISIIKRLNEDSYLNSYGGRELYDGEFFKSCGVKLQFIKMNNIKYQQGNVDFIPNLSIIDVMMWNDINVVKELLQAYDIIR